MSSVLDDLLAAVEEETEAGVRLPPVEKWNPPLSGIIDIRIDRNGEWFHEGASFERQSLVKLFSSILKREGENYYLVTPVEKWQIQVEDVPFLVTSLETVRTETGQALVFYTSVGDRVVAGPENPLRIAQGGDGDVRPYLAIRGGMEGLLSRPVYYQLADYIEEGPEKEKAAQGVYSLGVFFPLG